MAINRYSLDVIKDEEGIRVDTPQYVFHSKAGNIIFVDDLIKVIKANMPKHTAFMGDHNKGIEDALESILSDLDA